MKLSECMCKDVCFVKADCNLYDVARIMCENHIGCIPVCNDQRNIIGIITDRDILLRSVACNKDPKSTKVEEIMTTNVCTCGCEQDVHDAEKIMSVYQIRRIPVVDNSDKIVGILTIGDLAKNKKVENEAVCTTIENICNCGNNSKNND